MILSKNYNILKFYMDTETPFNLLLFTNETKKVCICSATSIFIIILFIISPLSNFFKTSLFMKIIALLSLVYTIYLNIQQTNLLKMATQLTNSDPLKGQLSTNLICSYIFTLFIGLLAIFVIKSFF
jgi:hypothetical protein